MRIYKVNQPMDVYKAQTMPKMQNKVSKEKDQVNVSQVGQEFQVAYKMVKSVPDVRMDKINDIKERIQSGNYSVSAKEVSEKIVSQLDLRG